jgi:hypothetical protein
MREPLDSHLTKAFETGLARPIERVVRIGRETVETDIAAVPAQLDLTFCRIVARLAKVL